MAVKEAKSNGSENNDNEKTITFEGSVTIIISSILYFIQQNIDRNWSVLWVCFDVERIALENCIPEIAYRSTQPNKFILSLLL